VDRASGVQFGAQLKDLGRPGLRPALVGTSLMAEGRPVRPLARLLAEAMDD
jgi:indole-3-glycerol phosphate synthase